MQVIFLLAGANKRFYPLNTDGHKAMVKLYGKPILQHVIQTLKDNSGLTEFIFTVSTNDTVIRNYFGDGSEIGVSIQYATLDNPDGQGAALLKASDLINGPFMVVNPYHIDKEGLFKKIMDFFIENKIDGVIPGIYEENIQHYGAIELENGLMRGIVEKPEPGTEPSHYRATSAYIFNPTFIEYLQNEPTDNHYSYESAISKYVKDHVVKMFEIPKDTNVLTLKYPWHLLNILSVVGSLYRGFISPTAKIAKSAIIGDDVYVDDGAVIHEGACIKGKTYIGKNAMIGNYSLVRDSDIGENVHVGVYSDITRSIIMENTHSHGSGFIGDSIIGGGCRLAYGFVTANKRLDRGMIHGYVNNKKISISSDFGAILGSNIKAGINVSIMPGVTVGKDVVIGAGVILYRNIEDNTQVVYKQLQEQEILKTNL
ncbi:MAG TPA: sugar phosphate nucleotidyltransferase [Candidatus Nitrosocosmicus sp.]|nr:sugar phosphate nucleotidyltransferase [Candidatus Nitrosocosmicus sp.]